MYRFHTQQLYMHVDIDKIRRQQTQEYKPRSFEPALSPYEKSRRRTFEQGSLMELFHENTKYAGYDQFRVGKSRGKFISDSSFVYTTSQINPDYEGRPRIELPEPEGLDASLDSVLASRRSQREFSGEPLSKMELSTLLGHSLGVTDRRTIGFDRNGEDVTQEFRAYPSGGGLYPVEHYIGVVQDTDGLDSGWYFYNIEEHCLRELDTPEAGIREQLDDLFVLFDESGPVNAGIILIMTAAFPRSRSKYGDRGYRHMHQEVGYAGENLLLVAEAMELGATPYDSYRDRAVEDVLNIDGVDEAPMTTMLFGHPQEDDQ